MASSSSGAPDSLLSQGGYCQYCADNIGGGTGGGEVGAENIRRGGIAPTIAHSHDSDTASPLY